MLSKPALRSVVLWLLVALPVGVADTYLLRPNGFGGLGQAAILIWGAVLVVWAHEAQRKRPN